MTTPAVQREKLRLARQIRFPGHTLKDVADMLGISRMHLIAIEQGRRDPQPELMVKWLELLGPGAMVDLFEPHPELEAFKGLAKRIKAAKALAEAAA